MSTRHDSYNDDTFSFLFSSYPGVSERHHKVLGIYKLDAYKGLLATCLLLVPAPSGRHPRHDLIILSPLLQFASFSPFPSQLVS